MNRRESESAPSLGRRLGGRRTIVVGGLCGTALWTSLGVLDVYAGANGPVRLAMLPSVGAWLGMIALATAVVGGLSVSLGRTPNRDGSSPLPGVVYSILAPLTASVVLVLPYLPWLPDVFPVLTVLAGPLRWVIWLVVSAETVRRVVLSKRPHPGPTAITSFGLAVSLFILGFLLTGLAAARLSGTVLYPAGDEPHYLIMAQSLWRDGDLAIENNHLREDYLEYFVGAQDLEPHYLTRGLDGEIYSVHPVGLPVVLAPVYALGGYLMVRLLLLFVSAGTLALVAWWMLELGLPRPAVLVGWLAVLSSAPFYFFTFAVYPETMAGLTVVAALLLITATAPPRGDALRWLGTGIAAASLPWLSTKYAPMAAALVVVALGRLWLTDADGRRPAVRLRARTLLVLLPFAVSVAAWLGFFDAVWGTPWPDAPYGGNAQTHLGRLPTGAPGLLIDQEYGILPNAPIYLVAFIGLATMWRGGGTHRRLAAEITLILGVLLGTVGAFHLWWGGTAPPGRPVVSGLPLLALPIAWFYAHNRAGPAARMAVRVLLWLSVGLTGLFALAREGLLLANARDGSSAMLEYLSPLWPLPGIFPTMIDGGPVDALRIIAVWLVVSLTALWLVARVGRLTGVTTLLATAGVTASGVVLSIVVPLVSAHEPPAAPLESRWEIGLLDRFDATRRPTGLVYDPLRLVDPARLVSLLHVEVSPPRSPAENGREADLLYGRRLALPKGRYELSVEPSDRSAPERSGRLSLIVGRLGSPLDSWEVTVSGQRTWTADFELVTDIGFLGFQASPELTDARPRIVVRATHVADVQERRNHPQVTATLRADTATFYFLDPYVWLEDNRFWTRGGRLTRILMTPPDDLRSTAVTARLRVHCGSIDNDIEVTSDEGHKAVSLAAGERHDFVVPVSRGTAHVDIRTNRGFTPSELFPGNTDPRYLGCQIESVTWLPSGSGTPGRP